MQPPVITVDVTLDGDALETVRAIAPATDWPTWVQTWMNYLAPDLSPIGAYELTIQLTSDATIADLNARYRQQDRPTDVLSFAVVDDTPLPPPVLAEIPFPLGDLIISVETAQRQCQTHGHSLVQELAWLSAHGVLHLLGWDHPDEASLQKMWSMQRELLAQVGISLTDSQYFMEAAKAPPQS